MTNTIVVGEERAWYRKDEVDLTGCHWHLTWPAVFEIHGAKANEGIKKKFFLRLVYNHGASQPYQSSTVWESGAKTAC